MLTKMDRSFPVDAAELAQAICLASEAEFVALFQRLQARRELSTTIHSINELLNDAEHAPKARAALHRIGLEFGG